MVIFLFYLYTCETRGVATSRFLGIGLSVRLGFIRYHQKQNCHSKAQHGNHAKVQEAVGDEKYQSDEHQHVVPQQEPCCKAAYDAFVANHASCD